MLNSSFENLTNSLFYLFFLFLRKSNWISITNQSFPQISVSITISNEKTIVKFFHNIPKRYTIHSLWKMRVRVFRSILCVFPRFFRKITFPPYPKVHIAITCTALPNNIINTSKRGWFPIRKHWFYRKSNPNPFLFNWEKVFDENLRYDTHNRGQKGTLMSG